MAVLAARPRVRDADRSRRAILDAAEALFAGRGFEAVSLQEIGDAAGLSRGTPNYFFGSKEDLYVARLQRIFPDRAEATQRAFAPDRDWSEYARVGPIRQPLPRAKHSYVSFQLARPAITSL